MNDQGKMPKKGKSAERESISEQCGAEENGPGSPVIKRAESETGETPEETAEKLAGSLSTYAEAYEPLDEIRPGLQKKIGQETEEKTLGDSSGKKA